MQEFLDTSPEFSRKELNDKVIYVANIVKRSVDRVGYVTNPKVLLEIELCGDDFSEVCIKPIYEVYEKGNLVLKDGELVRKKIPFKKIQYFFELIKDKFNYYMNYPLKDQEFIHLVSDINGMFVHKDVYEKTIDIGKRSDSPVYPMRRKPISEEGLDALGFKEGEKVKSKYFGFDMTYFYEDLEFVFNTDSCYVSNSDGKKFFNFESLVSDINSKGFNISFKDFIFFQQNPLKYDLGIVKKYLDSSEPEQLHQFTDFNKNQFLNKLVYFDSGSMNMNLDYFIQLYKEPLLCDNNSLGDELLNLIYFNFGIDELGLTYLPQKTTSDHSKRNQFTLEIHDIRKQIMQKRFMYLNDCDFYSEDDPFEIDVKDLESLSLIDFQSFKPNTLEIYSLDEEENYVDVITTFASVAVTISLSASTAD